MQDNYFLDTNLWIYLYIDDIYSRDKDKKSQVNNILHNASPFIWISSQVLNEVSAVLHKKYKITSDEISNYLKRIIKISNVFIVNESTTLSALELIKYYNFSFYDALIVASALQSNCKILYSEDMQHQQIIRNKLTIINPFL